jgi:hypothetical protein
VGQGAPWVGVPVTSAWGQVRRDAQHGDCLRLEDCDAAALEIVLRYMYTGELGSVAEAPDVPRNEVLVLAARLELPLLVAQLCRQAEKALSPCNVIVWLVAGQRASLEEFKVVCMAYLNSHAEAVRESGALDSLTGGELGECGTEVLMDVIGVLDS